MNPIDTANKLFLPASVIVAGLLIAGAVLWNGSRPPSALSPQAGGVPSVDIKDINTKESPFIGKEDASLTIALWGDFQCSFCKKFEVETLPEIIKNYVDTGKVKVVFMDFAFLGQDSIAAAHYGRAVWKLYPNSYFAWRTAMYHAQDEGGDKGFGNTESIDALTATIPGIDAVKVSADAKEHAATYQALIDADHAEAQKVGINATPSLVIGKEVVQGAYPYATFQVAIDKALKK